MTEVLAAAADRYNSVLDIYLDSVLPLMVAAFTSYKKLSTTLMVEYTTTRMIDALWLDLEEDKESDWEDALQLQLRPARYQGTYNRGNREYESFLRTLKDVIWLHLNIQEPARVSPLKVHICSDFVPIRVLQRKYRPEKRTCMEKYVENLLNLGFLKHFEAPESVSVPHIFPKKPPEMFRMAI